MKSGEKTEKKNMDDEKEKRDVAGKDREEITNDAPATQRALRQL